MGTVVKWCAQGKGEGETYDAGDDDAIFQGTDDTREAVTVGTAAAQSLTAAFSKEATVRKDTSADEDSDPEEPDSGEVRTVSRHRGVEPAGQTPREGCWVWAVTHRDRLTRQ